MTGPQATSIADQQFWDRNAPKFARKPINDIDAYEAMLRQVLQALRPGDRVLELGCGTGGTALQLARSVGHVTATDVSGQMIEIAQSTLGPNSPSNVVFRQADAAELIATSSFDAIFATSLLHLVRDVSLVLKQSFRQLKPGGLLITKTVCLKHTAAPTPIWVMVRLLTMFGFAPWVAKLSLEDLENELERAGFEIMHVEYFDKKRHNPFIIARRPSA